MTLNDDDQRPNVNKVRNFIPQIMKNKQGEVYLNPELKTVQFYNGIEIYFISVPLSAGTTELKRLNKKQKLAIAAAVYHVPNADLGVQYSANNSPYNSLVVKGEKMQLYFEEYSQNTSSHAFTLLHSGSIQIKLYSGPSSLGVYGFGSKQDDRGSPLNKKYIESWLQNLSQNNPLLQKYSLKLSDFDLAFAYAGDAEMIEDYVKAVQQLAELKKPRTAIIVYKGLGPIHIADNKIMIPLGAHAKELGHALISEAAYSPLITGDGSLSSALETTSANKSFLYENTEWKAQAMATLLNSVFKTNPELLEAAYELLIPLTKDLRLDNLTRTDRVNKIIAALKNISAQAQIHTFFSRRNSSLNIADNTINMFQFRPIFETLQKGFAKGITFSENYLLWLTELTKTFTAQTGLPFAQLQAQLDDKVYGRASQLLEKWYSLFTLWELGQSVKPEAVRQVIVDTAGHFRQKETQAKIENQSLIFQLLDQINISTRSKYGLYESVKNHPTTYADLTLIRQQYNQQSRRRFLLSRQSVCHQFYFR